MHKIIKKIVCNFLSITKFEEKNYSRKQLNFLGIRIKLKKNYSLEAKFKQSEALAIFKSTKSALLDNDKQKYRKKFLLFRYNYPNISHDKWGVNLGDYMQTIATKKIITQICKDVAIDYWDRDDLLYYNGCPAFTIMQGWFSHSDTFLPNEKIIPIFIGTHVTKNKRDQFKKFVKSNREYFKSIIFGCRDISTQNFIKSIGLKSYFSRCLTLTLPKRKDSNYQNKTYIVDIPDNMLRYIPQNLKDNAIYVNQRGFDGNKESSYYINSEERYIKKTLDLLQEYRDNAALIITSALHCASPCIAMGIPTVLIDFERKNDRFGSLHGIFKFYKKKDLINGRIDFNPKPVDIEKLKYLMIENVRLSIKQAFSEDISINKLNLIRSEIEGYKI